MGQTAYMRERIGQIEKTGSYFCIINAVLLLLMSLMDYYLLDSPWLLLFRAAPFLASIAFLAHVYLTRKKVSSFTLPLYILFLFSLVAMAVGVDVQLHFMESTPAHLHDAPMNGIILSLFIVYLVSAGARIWFPLFAGLPVGAGLAVLYLADVTHHEMVPHSLILITFIVLAVLSRVQERLVKKEFDARALADEKMREAEREKEKFQQLFQFAPDAIFLQTLDGHIVDCNRKAEEISGYSRSELLGMNVSDLVPERYKGLIPGEAEELRTEGENFAIGTNIRKDGEEYPVEVSSRSISREGLAHALVIVRDITERVKDAEEIKKLSTAVEHSPASIIITTTTDGSILYTNPKFTEVTGYSREEVYGRNPRILRSGAHPKEFYSDMWKTILSGEEWRGELQNLTKGGDVYWESASIAPIINESGELAYFVAVKEDITEKKRREEEIHHLAMYDQLTSLANRTLFSDSLEREDTGFMPSRENNSMNDQEKLEKFRSYVEASHDIIYEVSLEGKVLYVSPVIEDITGYSREEALGADFHSFVFPEDVSKVQETHRRLLESGESQETEARMVYADGSIHIYHAHGSPLLDPEGKLVSIVVILRDMTEQRRMVEELRLSEERYRSYMENAPYAVFIADSQGKLREANSNSTETLGYSREELLSMSIFDLAHPDGTDQLHGLFPELQTEGRIKEEKLRKKGGIR